MKDYILYDASSAQRSCILDRCEMTEEEANKLNAQLRAMGSDARWIIYREEPEDMYY